MHFFQNYTTDDPPTDYFVDVDEDYHIDGILETITLSDYFSTGPYDLSLWKGKNEFQYFISFDNM